MGVGAAADTIGGDPVAIQFEKDKQQTVWPASTARNLLFIRNAVRVNGKNIGYVLVDTGSNVTVLDSGCIRKLSLEQVGELQINKEKAGLFIADTLEVGPLTIRKQTLGGMDLSALQCFTEPVVGILGGDVLGRIPFSVDYARPSLVLYNPEQFKPPKGAMEFDLVLVDSSVADERHVAESMAAKPAVEGVVDGRKMLLQLDTGLSIAVLLSRQMADDKGLTDQKPAHALIAPKGVTDTEGPAYELQVKRLEMLGRIWQNVAHSFTEVKTSPDREPVGREVGVVGGSILRHCRLTFDYGHRKLWVESSAGVEDRVRSGTLALVSTDFAGLSPLAEGVLEGDYGTFAALLKMGADPGFVAKDGQTLLHLAVRGGSAEVLDALLKQAPLANIDRETIEGGTRLMMAATIGDPVLAAKLIESGASIDHQARTGDTALSCAVNEGAFETVRLLLSKGAKFHLALRDGTTPIATAAARGDKRVFDLLLDAGAGLDMNSAPGRTLLHFAAFGGNTLIIQSVLKNAPHIMVDKADSQGATALMIASQMGRKAAVELLLKTGANPRLLSSPDMGEGKNALHYASLNGYEDVMKVLLDHGAAVDEKTSNGLTALMLAAGKGHGSAVDFLLTSGADVNAIDRYRASALFYATKYLRSLVIPILLQGGAKIDMATIGGMRPLDYAALNGDVDSARLLVKAGADPKDRGAHGSSAVDFARKAGHSRLADLLENGLREVPEAAVPGK